LSAVPFFGIFRPLPLECVPVASRDRQLHHFWQTAFLPFHFEQSGLFLPEFPEKIDEHTEFPVLKDKKKSLFEYLNGEYQNILRIL
jgi:hypothetical protein